MVAEAVAARMVPCFAAQRMLNSGLQWQPHRSLEGWFQGALRKGHRQDFGLSLHLHCSSDLPYALIPLGSVDCSGREASSPAQHAGQTELCPAAVRSTCPILIWCRTHIPRVAGEGRLQPGNRASLPHSFLELLILMFEVPYQQEWKILGVCKGNESLFY